jgi:hypothetical protein
VVLYESSRGSAGVSVDGVVAMMGGWQRIYVHDLLEAACPGWVEA